MDSKNSLTEIPDQVYEDFVRYTCDGVRLEDTDPTSLSRLRIMIQSDRFTVAYDHTDEILGTADRRVIEKNTGKVVLAESQKQTVIDVVADRYKGEKFPLGKCLQAILKHYSGFPLVKLKRDLQIALGVEPDKPVQQMYESFQQNVRGPKKRMPRENEIITIPDIEYDLVARVIAGELHVQEINDPLLAQNVDFRVYKSPARLSAIYWDQPDEYLDPGWRLIESDTGRIVPRTSEIGPMYDKMRSQVSQEHSLPMLVAEISRRYTGFNKTKMMKQTPQPRKGPPKVLFPQKPKNIGARPMQFVQIDIIDMDDSDYGDRCYNKLLVVTDLFSRYIFGRALSDRTDQSLIVRHLMDIFGAFGPPEAFRSFTKGDTVAICMEDVEKLFKITVKNVGQANMAHYQLRKNIYLRSERDLGTRERWVEALPFAIIEFNQKTHRNFDFKLTPFEVMFGRRPWNPLPGLPPWIDSPLNDMNDSDEYYDDFDNEGSRAVRNINAQRPEPSSSQSVLQVSSQVGQTRKLTEARDLIEATIMHGSGRRAVQQRPGSQITDPGTGYLFQVGDPVYIRNLEWKQSLKADLKKRIPKQFRATVGEVDLRSNDFPYRVHFWPQDDANETIPFDQWPDENAPDLWVGPYDITGATLELNKQRSLVKREDSNKWRCRCGDQLCNRLFNDLCEFKMSQHCCVSRNQGCNYHRHIRRLNNEVKQVSTPGVRQKKIGPQAQMNRSAHLQSPGSMSLASMGTHSPVKDTSTRQLPASRSRMDAVRLMQFDEKRDSGKKQQQKQQIDQVVVENQTASREGVLAKQRNMVGGSNRGHVSMASTVIEGINEGVVDETTVVRISTPSPTPESTTQVTRHADGKRRIITSSSAEGEPIGKKFRTIYRLVGPRQLMKVSAPLATSTPVAHPVPTRPVTVNASSRQQTSSTEAKMASPKSGAVGPRTSPRIMARQQLQHHRDDLETGPPTKESWKNMLTSGVAQKSEFESGAALTEEERKAREMLSSLLE